MTGLLERYSKVRLEIISQLSQTYREFKKTTSATAMGKSLNKRFDEQNNGCACAL